MKRQPITITFFVLAFTACELIIEPDLPGHTPRLVVKAFFTSDTRWTASISRSIGILEPNPGRERLVTDATVQLLLDGQVIDRLHFFSSERVYASQTHLAVDKSYTIRVTAPGFDTVHASDSIPEPVPTSVVSYRIESGDQVDGEYGTIAITEFIIKLKIQDPPGEQNHYQILAFAPDRSGRFGLRISTRDPSIIADNRIEDSVLEGVEPFVGSEPFFKDALFDGESHEVEISSPNYQVEVSPERRIWVQVRHISEAYYKHLRSALLHKTTDDNPFAEPVRMYSNVENGYGIFAGYSSQTFELMF